jgi:hypothetical protein
LACETAGEEIGEWRLGYLPGKGLEIEDGEAVGFRDRANKNIQK